MSIIRLAAEVDGKSLEADVAVMHPIACLRSRIANMLSPATMRRDAFAWKQLQAAIDVSAVYIGDALDDAEISEAHLCFMQLHNYIKSDLYGRRALTELGVDLLDILKKFEHDSRLDPRYRMLTLGKMIARIQTGRQRRHGNS